MITRRLQGFGGEIFDPKNLGNLGIDGVDPDSAAFVLARLFIILTISTITMTMPLHIESGNI